MLTWEKISVDGTERIAVHGGWIVRCCMIINAQGLGPGGLMQKQIIPGGTAITFVPDPEHLWGVND